MILLNTNLIKKKYGEYLKDGDYSHLVDIAGEIHSVYMGASSETLQCLSKKIDENINFYRGNHWLHYDSNDKRYKPYPSTKYNKKVEKSTTNLVASEVDTIVSLLTRTKENILVVSNSNSAEDKNKAKIGEAILEGSYYLNDELYNKILFVKTAVLCGTAYRKDYWDASVNTIDDEGKEIKGDTATKILSPLQIIPDYQNAIRDIDDGTYTIEFGYHPTEDIKNMYDTEGMSDEEKEGFTGKAKEIKESDDINIQLDYLQKLISPDDSSNKSVKNYSILLEVYIKPCKKFKKGVMIICTANDVLYINENKIYNQFGGRFWSPYTMVRYKRDIFNHYGISLPELIIPLNKDINRIDSLVMLNRATMVSPKLMIPIGSMLPDQQISGRPAEHIYYKPGVGEKPTFEYGKSLDQSVLQEREQKVMDISKLSGSNEVLQGQRPVGVSTAAGLNLLLEQSYSKFNTTIFEIENALAKAYTKVLNLKRYCYTLPRQNYIKRIKALNNSVSDVAINDFFKGSDLGNNIDVRVESGSSSPKSLVMEQNNIKEVAQMGVFGVLDPVQNPIGNQYFLSKFGLSKFKTQTNSDTTRALWENDLIRHGRFEDVKVMPIDDNVIHYKVLNEEIKKPDFYDNNTEEVVAGYWKHLCEHFLVLTDMDIQMLQISPQKMQELEIMSVNLGVQTQEEFEMKIQQQQMQQQQMMMQEQMMQEQAMIGQKPNSKTVPPQEGPMPNDSMVGTGANRDFFSGEQIG